MRIAWFSPLPPARSGIAAYSADLVPRLAPAHAVDCFSEVNACDFLWKARREPYDLVVYQLGNAPCQRISAARPISSPRPAPDAHVKMMTE